MLLIIIIGHLYGPSVQMGRILHRRHGNGRFFIWAAFRIFFFFKEGAAFSRQNPPKNSEIDGRVCGRLVTQFGFRFVKTSRRISPVVVVVVVAAD